MSKNFHSPDCSTGSYENHSQIARIMARELLATGLQGRQLSELVSESLLQALIARNRKTNGNKKNMCDKEFRGLLRIVIKRQAIKLFARDRKVELELMQNEPEDHVDSVVDVTIQEETSKLLRAAIYELPPQPSSVLRCLLNGLTCSQIAEELDLKIKQVYGAIERGKQILREKLDQEVFFDV